MRNITDILARYLSDINLPSVSIIDIIEIILITFFVYQFMVWIKFTRAYTLLKGLLVIGAFLIIAYIFKIEYDPVDRIKTGQCTDHGDRCNIST